MSLKEVKEDILKEAKSRKKELIAEAEKEKKEKLKEAKKETKKLEKEVEEEIKKEKESMRKKEISKANMEAKKIELEAKNELVDEVFDQFQAKVRSMTEEEKISLLESALNETKFAVGTVKGSPIFEDIVRDKGLNFEETEEKTKLILVSEDGEKQRNYSREKIIEEFKNDYQEKISKKMFN